MKPHTFLPLLLLCLTSVAYAGGDEITYNRIKLSVSASQPVDNDTLVSLLYAQQEGSDTSRLTNEVNSRIAAAVKLAQSDSAIQVQTLDYSTSPIYNKRILSGWRVRQSIRLESRDGAALSRMIGKLQKQLNVSSIRYVLSPQRRQQAEDELIRRAIAAFKARAALISGEMGAKDYRLVQMTVSQSGGSPRPYPMRAMAMENAADAAPPTLEAGTQQVQIRIDGSIELEP